ncbi:MAG: transposase [Janthinobacterium lividum]
MHATERDTDRVRARRAAFLESLSDYDVTRFKFVDETSVNLTYTRRYGQAVGGARLRQGAAKHTGPNVTVVGALTVRGLEAVTELDGALDAASFTLYIGQVPGPSLQVGDVVGLDNLPVHQVAGMRERLESWGVQVLYLPPYSPDFAPIERGWSKPKTWLRTAQARTRALLTPALVTAADWITAQDAQNWFAGCGYHVH